MKHLLIAICSLSLLVSCQKEKTTSIEETASEKTTPIDYVAKNEQEIKDYLAQNNLTAQRTESGLYYVILNQGTGANPVSTSNVTVAYKGYFTNKAVFDQSADTGISFGLNGVIPGWTEGIPFFKTGGNGILLIPAHLGYGNNTYGPIPGGSVLIFDIKLLSIK